MKNREQTKNSEFGYYNGLTYRICYGLTDDGKMDYSKELYEFSKYCNCSNCVNRLSYSRISPNHLTITTDDKNKFQEIFETITAYTCNSNKKENNVYIRV